MYKFVIGIAAGACAAVLAVRAVQIKVKRKESIIEVR